MAAPDVRGTVEPLASFVRFGLVLAPRAGRELRIVSGRRSASEQQALRVAHCPDPVNSPASACTPPTAPVGSSKHQTGQAIDMGGDLSWFAKLVQPFNVTRPVRVENWHFEWRGNNAEKDLRALAEAAKQVGVPVGDVIVGGVPTDDGGIDLVDVLDAIVPGDVSGVLDFGSDALNAAFAPLSTIADAFSTIGDVFDRVRALFEPANLPRLIKGVAGVYLLWAGFGLAVTAIFGVERVVGAIGGGVTGGPAGAAVGAAGAGS